LGKVKTKNNLLVCNNIFVSNIVENVATKDHNLSLQSVVEYESQIEEFFIKVRKFNGTGLNPKCDIIANEVSEADIKEVLGKVVKFKITNTQLHANTKKDLLHLCSHIYDMSNVTNNELMSWAMKGYIAQMKGCDVNWARAATLTAKEKACRLVVEKLRSGRSSNVSRLSLKGVSCKIELGDVVCKNFGLPKVTRGKGICPYAIPLAKLAQV
jgi:hypothetical protein